MSGAATARYPMCDAEFHAVSRTGYCVVTSTGNGTVALLDVEQNKRALAKLWQLRAAARRQSCTHTPAGGDRCPFCGEAVDHG